MAKSQKLMMVIGFIIVLVISACSSESNLTPSATLRGAIVPTRISTDTPTATSTATDTPTPTSTPTDTSTPTTTPSNTPTPTATDTETPTPTLTPTINQTQVADNIDTGDTFIDLGSLDRAIESYTAAIELDPEATDAYLGRGLAFYRSGQYEPAIEDFDTVIELEPDYIDAYFNRGLTHMELLNAEEAFNDFTTVTDFDPEDYEAYYYLAILHFDEDESEEGLENIEIALELNPRFEEAFAARAMYYYLNEDYENALPDLESYVNIAGTDASEDLVNLLDETRAQLATPTPIQPATADAPPPTNEAGPDREPKQIQYGDEETQTITLENYEFRYQFDATAGDRIDIKMNADTGTTLDPYIVLLDESEDVIAENDDDLNNTGRNSFLQGFVIPADGTYTIIATRFQQELGTTVGGFKLILEPSPDLGSPPPPTPAPLTGNTLQYGDLVSGEINNDTPSIEYDFVASAGDLVNIQMVSVDSSRNLDPLLILVNTNGDTLAENDDDSQGTGRNSFIRAYEIPEDGTYTIIATRFQQELGSTNGTFDLTLNVAEESANSGTTEPSAHIEYGDTYDGEITRDISEVRLTFDAEAGDSVDIRMQASSGTLDSLLIVLDEDGEELIRNDDDEQGIGRDSFVRAYEIPADGTYTIVATRFQQEMGSTTGRFTLTVEKVVVEA